MWVQNTNNKTSTKTPPLSADEYMVSKHYIYLTDRYDLDTECALVVVCVAMCVM